MQNCSKIHPIQTEQIGIIEIRMGIETHNFMRKADNAKLEGQKN